MQRLMLRSAGVGRQSYRHLSDFYGPHVTNQIIREALRTRMPLTQDCHQKIGARRGMIASWPPAFSPEERTGGA